MKGFIFVSCLITLISLIFILKIPERGTLNDSSELSELEQLGKKLFFDTILSSPTGVSCATCHDPKKGFADFNNNQISFGANPTFKNTRNTPMASYTRYIPALYYDRIDSVYKGGLFVDGRVNSLQEQVQHPFLGRTEMNNSSKKRIVEKVRHSVHYATIINLFGKSIFKSTEEAFSALVKSIVAYEKSNEVNPFSSKFDLYLKGEVQLTKNEKKGKKLFEDPKKGNCVACHPLEKDKKSGKVLFTDFSYDNLGIPAIKKNTTTKDLGLGKIIDKQSENGKFRVPSLRNIAVTTPYFHNGKYKTLTEVMDFYNSRDTGRFGSPEVDENVNTEELGNLKLSLIEQQLIIDFMKTLTDGYEMKKK